MCPDGTTCHKGEINGELKLELGAKALIVI